MLGNTTDLETMHIVHISFHFISCALILIINETKREDFPVSDPFIQIFPFLNLSLMDLYITWEPLKGNISTEYISVHLHNRDDVPFDLA